MTSRPGARQVRLRFDRGWVSVHSSHGGQLIMEQVGVPQSTLKRALVAVPAGVVEGGFFMAMTPSGGNVQVQAHCP